MGLLDLADELLLQIFNSLDSVDLYKLCCCNKRLNAFTLPILYGTIIFLCERWRRRFSINLQKFILTIQRYPHRTRWVRTARLGYSEDQETDRRLIFFILPQLSLIEDLELEVIDSELAIALQSPHRRGDDAAWVVANPSHFSQLRRLTIAYSRMDIDGIINLGALPKLNHIKIVKFDPRLSIGGPLYSQGTPLSNVQSLEFYQSGEIVIEPMRKMLERFPKLKKLTWESRAEWSQPKTSSVMQSFLDLLMSTVVELTLYPASVSTSDPWVLDFSKFEVLESLKVCGDDILAVDTLSERSSPSNQNTTLEKLLPPSLKDLKFLFIAPSYNQYGSRHLSEHDFDWLLPLADAKPYSLPLLRSVSFTPRIFCLHGTAAHVPELEWDFPDTVKNRFKDADIKLEKEQGWE